MENGEFATMVVLGTGVIGMFANGYSVSQCPYTPSEGKNNKGARGIAIAEGMQRGFMMGFVASMLIYLMLWLLYALSPLFVALWGEIASGSWILKAMVTVFALLLTSCVGIEVAKCCIIGE